MDNSPRFDRATQLDAVDFNAFLALECEIMAGFAGRLNRIDEAGLWKQRHRNLCQLINERLWSEEAGFYVDFDVDRDEPSPVLSSAGFLPLICGTPSQEQASRLATRLQDPGSFASPLRVPSIAISDVEHYAKDMWRGPVWVNLNWLIAYGLERYGFNDLAKSLRQETIAAIEEGYEAYGTFFEFFDDRQEVPPPELLRKGRCAPQVSPYHQVFHDYGWTATLYCDWLHGNPVYRP
jgi:neutral trehalase